ncbi:hypothetical protein RUND412_011545, partial [Rhizina undulata]
KERSDILKWLSTVPFEDHHLFIRPSRQAGTGEWLLKKKEFIYWKDSSSSSILWLRGIAGAGKTVLASCVIDTFESSRSNNDAVLYFYCKHGEKERQDPLSILSSLVKQLSLLMSPEGSQLPQPVVSIFKNHEHKSGKLQLSESQELIASLAKNFIRTAIVIDALDECDKESRKKLLTALEVIMKSSAGVFKIFVTSRPADDIELKLEGVPNVYIQSSDNSGDIAAFVKAAVEKCISKKLLLRGWDVSLGQLTDKEHLRQKSSNEINNALQRLPKSLKDTYSVIWEKICGQSDGNKLLAGSTLKWIVCARSPLTEAEIIDAVSIEPLDFTGDHDHQGLKIQDLLDVCQNLIVMDEQLGVLRTAHFSVDEFLEDHFKMTEAHNHATEICLTLMRRPKIYDKPPMPPPNDYYYSRNFYEDQQPTARPHTYDELHPLRYYIFDNWPHHVRFSDDTSTSVLEFQKQFFDPSTFNAWLQEAGKQWTVFRPMEQEDKLTPLWVACYYQLWAICKNVLKSNVDNCAIRNKKGQTPVVQLLLTKEGIDINSKGYSGRTPLWAAASGGHESVVRLLIAKEGIDINSKDKSGQTPLWFYASRGHESVVRLLIAKEGIDINSKNNRDETPLWAAARGGRGSIVRLLIAKEGIDINSKNNDGQTPLWAAAMGGHESVVRLLLEKMFLDINSKPEFDDIYTTMGASRRI